MMNKKVNDVMNALIQKLQKQIQANERIIGASFEFTEFGRSEGNTFLSGIATGTVIAPRMTRGGGRIKKRRQTRKQTQTRRRS